MDSTITLEQFPIWFIGLCVLAGLIGAFLLYFKDKTFKEASRRQRWLLFPISILRFLAITAIALLLLAPLIKTRVVDVVQRSIVILQDNTESVRLSFERGDSSQLSDALKNINDGLSEKFRVETYHFGDKLDKGFKFDYDKKLTNISQSLDDLGNIYANQNLAAIVLATDGIYNEGSNPIYSVARLDVPIYSVAIGDTTPKRDLVLDKVLHNNIAYLGDKFTIRVDLSAKNSKGQSTSINIYAGNGTDNKITSRAVSIKDNDFVHSEEFILSASKPGINQYTVTLNRIKDEITTQNNRQTIFIEVLDTRQKILLLGASPHPDMSAIRQSLSENKNYETKTAFINDFKGSTKEYDIAILHGLPAQNNTADDVINELKKSKIPTWFIVSSQTSIPNLNQLQSLVKINGSNPGVTNDVKCQGVEKFTLFNIEKNVIKTLESLPPLMAPFGDMAASPTTQTLLTQKVGNVATSYPLLVIEQATSDKNAIFLAEGLWRWRLYNFKAYKNHLAFDEMVSKVVQYLSVKNDKRKFRVNTPKTLYGENETIRFDAELYNESYELINGPEVNMNIYDKSGKAFPKAFTKTENAYELNVPPTSFPVGAYTWKANTTLNGKDYTAEGRFSIAPIELESMQTTANHRMLYNLSDKYGGHVAYPSNVSSIVDSIKNNPEFTPIQYSSFKTKPIINLKWLFGFLLGFLAIEWFVRKWLGGY